MILIKIRLLQIFREARAAGIYSIPVAATFIFLVYYFAEIYKIEKGAWILITLIFITCLSIQLSRSDKLFVFTHINNSYFEIYTEYVALSLPFSITSLLTDQWFCYPVLLFSLLPVPMIRFNVKRTTMLRNISFIIPPSDFEWISGFRKSFVLLVPIYFLALAFSWFRILPLFLLWFFTISILPFYNECESMHILREGNLSPEKFLKNKISRHFRYLLLLSAPVLIVNTIFNFDDWLVNFVFIPVQLSLIVFAISLKYAFYRPNQKFISKNILLSFISISSVIPYFLPLPVIMSVIYYRKAKNNLSNYLDD